MITYWLAALVVLTAWMAGAWLVQWRLGNAGWVDVFWTFGTGAGAALLALSEADGDWHRHVLVAVMAGAWSLRLGLYIAVRVARSSGEDVRYVRFRKEWGADFQPRMARFVIIQGPIAAILAGAAMLAAGAPAPFPAVSDGLGLAALAAGALIEAISDWQMRRCRAALAAPGGICDIGLWRLSRHPNYFGEFLLWWAYPVMAIGGGARFGWLALAAPAMMYWLLVYVSGIPPLEREMLESRGEVFRAYQQRVPAFWPRIGKIRAAEK